VKKTGRQALLSTMADFHAVSLPEVAAGGIGLRRIQSQVLMLKNALIATVVLDG